MLYEVFGLFRALFCLLSHVTLPSLDASSLSVTKGSANMTVDSWRRCDGRPSAVPRSDDVGVEPGAGRDRIEPKIGRLKNMVFCSVDAGASFVVVASLEANGLIEFSTPMGRLGINLGKPNAEAGGEAERSVDAPAVVAIVYVPTM